MTELKSARSIWPRDAVYWWTFLFITFGLAWRIGRFAIAMPIWGDEAMLGLNFIGRSYRDLLKPLNDVQVAPIGFLWLQRLTFDFLGVNDYSTRLISLVAGVAMIFLFWKWAALLVSRNAAMLATGVVASSDYIVRHAVELKPYSIDFLVTTWLFYLATQYFLTSRRKYLIWLAVSVPICVFNSYPVVFSAGGVAIALWWQAIRVPSESRAQNSGCSWTDRLLVLTYCVLLGASFLLMLHLAAQNQYLHTAERMVDYWHGAFPPAHPREFIVWFMQIHTGNMFAYPTGGKYGGRAVTFICFLGGWWVMWSKWKSPVRLLLLTPFLLTFLAAVVRRYPYGESDRISQHLAPIIILLMGAGIAGWVEYAQTQFGWKFRLNFAAGLILAVGLGFAVRNFRDPSRSTGDTRVRQTIRSMIARSMPNEPILVLHRKSRVYSTIQWYLQDQNHRVRFETMNYISDVTAKADFRGCWIINCDRNCANLEQILARDYSVTAATHSNDELQFGLHETARMHLEIIHLTR